MIKPELYEDTCVYDVTPCHHSCEGCEYGMNKCEYCGGISRYDAYEGEQQILPEECLGICKL